MFDTAAVIVFGTFAVPAFACVGPQNQPAQYMTVMFEKNSSTIHSSSIVALASWSADMKIRYPIRLWTTVVGTAAPNEANPLQLATQRANKVKTLTDLFDISKTSSDVKRYVNTAYMAEMNGDKATAVFIDLNPGCPNNCCDALTTDSTEK
ncbi:hypothetical protein [Caballeronia udeis]|nr:hypothetical protein [Caballeronia udeis]